MVGLKLVQTREALGLLSWTRTSVVRKGRVTQTCSLEQELRGKSCRPSRLPDVLLWGEKAAWEVRCGRRSWDNGQPIKTSHRDHQFTEDLMSAAVVCRCAGWDEPVSRSHRCLATEDCRRSIYLVLPCMKLCVCLVGWLKAWEEGARGVGWSREEEGYVVALKLLIFFLEQ